MCLRCHLIQSAANVTVMTENFHRRDGPGDGCSKFPPHYPLTGILPRTCAAAPVYALEIPDSVRPTAVCASYNRRYLQSGTTSVHQASLSTRFPQHGRPLVPEGACLLLQILQAMKASVPATLGSQSGLLFNPTPARTFPLWASTASLSSLVDLDADVCRS